MTTIKAQGKTTRGNASVTITGDKYVSKIICNNEVLRGIIIRDIKNGSNLIANYAPPKRTMLQALATLQLYFNDDNIKVEGHMDKIPQAEMKGKGVVY